MSYLLDTFGYVGIILLVLAIVFMGYPVVVKVHQALLALLGYLGFSGADTPPPSKDQPELLIAEQTLVSLHIAFADTQTISDIISLLASMQMGFEFGEATDMQGTSLGYFNVFVRKDSGGGGDTSAYVFALCDHSKSGAFVHQDRTEHLVFKLGPITKIEAPSDAFDLMQRVAFAMLRQYSGTMTDGDHQEVTTQYLSNLSGRVQDYVLRHP